MCSCTQTQVCEDCSLEMEENYRSERLGRDETSTCTGDAGCVCDKCWQAHLDSGDADWFFGNGISLPDELHELDYKYEEIA